MRACMQVKCFRCMCIVIRRNVRACSSSVFVVHIIIRKLRAEQDYIKEAHFASLVQFTSDLTAEFTSRRLKPGMMIKYLSCYFIVIFSVNYRAFHFFRLNFRHFSYYVSCCWTEISGPKLKTGIIYSIFSSLIPIFCNYNMLKLL